MQLTRFVSSKRRIGTVSYTHLVYTICYQMVRDHGEAENLAQETFLSAYPHRDAAPPRKLKPWLARIATNKAKDYLKSAWARRVETSDALPDGAGSGPQPEALFLKKEELARLQDHIYACLLYTSPHIRDEMRKRLKKTLEQYLE